MIDVDRFICPKCRDFKFKSGYKPDGTLTRTCRGQRAMIDDDGAAVIIECAFSWPATDDWKYMHTVVCASGPDDTFKKTVTALWLRTQVQPLAAAHVIPVPVTDATLRRLLALAIEGASDRWLLAVAIATPPPESVSFSDVPFCGGSLTAIVRRDAATPARVIDRGALVYGLLTLAHNRGQAVPPRDDPTRAEVVVLSAEHVNFGPTLRMAEIITDAAGRRHQPWQLGRGSLASILVMPSPEIEATAQALLASLASRGLLNMTYVAPEKFN